MTETLAAPEAGPWAELAHVPPGGLRAAVARRLFTRAVPRLDAAVLLPDGTNLGSAAPGVPAMRLVRPEAFFRRVGTSGLVGFGEAYLAGDWTADDPAELARLLTAFCANLAGLVPAPLQRLRRLALHARPETQRGTADNARRNVASHYDLSNDLFALFLDPTMTYSSALFGPPGSPDRLPATWAGLPAAQHRKIDRLLDATGVGPGTNLLEIGTGWGELALRAAARGARVRSLTLSAEQRELALSRARDAGLDGRIEVNLCDYRDARGSYDAIVSVEMVEAVGFEYWPAYFGALDRLLAPGGRVGLQAITMPHDRMLASRDTYTWIAKYVFPGGLCPSVRAVREAVARHTRLEVADTLAFGPDYAETLRLWRERFTARAPQVAALGFDETFRRMWTFYLAYSEAGFRSGYLDVHQFVLAAGSRA